MSSSVSVTPTVVGPSVRVFMMAGIVGKLEDTRAMQRKKPRMRCAFRAGAGRESDHAAAVVLTASTRFTLDTDRLSACSMPARSVIVLIGHEPQAPSNSNSTT